VGGRPGNGAWKRPQFIKETFGGLGTGETGVGRSKYAKKLPGKTEPAGRNCGPTDYANPILTTASGKDAHNQPNASRRAQ